MRIQTQKDEVAKSNTIIKKRLLYGKKQYLVLQGEVYNWKNEQKLSKKDVQRYEEDMKDFVPYFSVEFVPHNKHVMDFEDGKLNVTYNGRPIKREQSICKKGRIQVLKELNQLFPIQLYQAMYLDSKQRQKADKYLIDKKAQ